jgi:hypothetical protein
VPRSSPSPTIREEQVTANTNENSNLGRVEPSTIDGTSASQATLRPLAGVCCNDAFANFQLQITVADRLSAKDRNKLLRKAFLVCCPASGFNAWKYNVMVLRHVIDKGWYWAPIIGEQHTTATPPIYTPMFSELLDSLQIILSRAPGDLYLHRLLKQLAQSALHTNHKKSPDSDEYASRLIRQLWQSALSRGSQKVSALKELLTALTSKIRSRHERGLLLNLISDPINARTHIVYSITRVVNTPDHFASAERALSCIPKQLLVALAPEVTLYLAEAVQYKSSLSRSIYVNRLNVWLQLAQNLESQTGFDTSLFDSVLASLAKVVSASRRCDRLRPEILMNAMLFRLAEQEDFKSERASRFVETYSSTLWEQSHVSFVEQLEHLTVKMREESLPYGRLLELSLPLIARHASLDLVLRCLNMLRRQGFLVPDVVLDTYIVDRMANIRAQAGVTNKEVQRNAYALRMCQNILSALDRINSPLKARVDELDTMHVTRQFEHLVSRAEDSHTLPIAFRNSIRDMSTKQRIGLVHQLAHLYSLDTTRTHRQSYRSIAYLYRYLSLNSFPIGPLFTKAVVQAAIIRPLSENRFVSARRLIWVCQLVAKVEGESAARQLENEFWQRRGEVIQHAKTVFMHLGGDPKDKAHVSTMKRLNQI